MTFSLVNAQLFEKEHNRIRVEWADVTASALLLAYMSTQAAPNVLLAKSLWHSTPLRICKLWGLNGDKHPSCLKNLEHGRPYTYLKELIGNEFENAWKDIRNHEVAHFVPDGAITKRSVGDLVELCILVGYYIEELTQYAAQYVPALKSKSTPFMYKDGGLGRDFKSIVDVEDHLMSLLSQIYIKPLKCDIDRYLEIADKTGKYEKNLYYRIGHKTAVWSLYDVHKKHALIKMLCFQLKKIKP